MSAAPAIAANTGAALIGGATPFGWAALGANLLGGAVQGQPAGPAISETGAGGTLIGFDSSGWTVATSGGQASATTGDRGGLTGAGALPFLNGSASMSTGTLLLIGAALVVGLLLWKR